MSYFQIRDRQDNYQKVGYEVCFEIHNPQLVALQSHWY